MCEEMKIEPKIDLDDLTGMKALDSKGMAEAIAGLPDHCKEAWELGAGLALPKEYREAKNIIILGIGGSAIGGDFVRALLLDEVPIPIFVNRDYNIPAFVGKETLIIASSYSGNTEETINAYSLAVKRGAKGFCITSGGKLEELAKRDGTPVIKLPSGLAPRAALGYLFIPILAVLEALGLTVNKKEELEEAIGVLENLREALSPAAPTSVNQAKRLAGKMFGKMAFIYGTSGISGAAAYRWKCQLNENSKAHAHSNVFPELNHNETVGWGAPESISGDIELVILRDKGDSPRVDKRIEITKTLMRGAYGIDEVWSIGRSELARLLSLVYVGDFTSLYLAFLYGVDPTPVEAIEFLKRELAR